MQSSSLDRGVSGVCDVAAGWLHKSPAARTAGNRVAVYDKYPNSSLSLPPYHQTVLVHRPEAPNQKHRKIEQWICTVVAEIQAFGDEAGEASLSALGEAASGLQIQWLGMLSDLHRHLLTQL